MRRGWLMQGGKKCCGWYACWKKLRLKKPWKTCSSGLCAPLGKTRGGKSWLWSACRVPFSGFSSCFPRASWGRCPWFALASINWFAFAHSLFKGIDCFAMSQGSQAGLTSWMEQAHILPCHRCLECCDTKRVFQNCKGQPNARANARARSPEICLREWIFVRMDRNATLICKEIGNFSGGNTLRIAKGL